jgi:sortase A
MQVKLQLRKDPGATARHIRRIAHWLLFSLGLVILGYVAVIYFEGILYQAYEAREFEGLLRPPVPTSVPPATGAAYSKRASEHVFHGISPKTLPMAAPKTGSIGRMQIPRLGLSVMVAEGVDAPQLALGAGHVPGTALPGQPGNVAVAGHRDTFFRKLRELQKNDVVQFTTLSGTYDYTVESMQIVSPNDVQVLRASKQPMLTLVTCYPFYYIGPAPRRFIVQARQIHSAGSPTRWRSSASQ